MGNWFMACIDPQHWHALPSYPLLKEKLVNALLGAHWIGK